MVESQSKLEAAFLAGRMDAGAERIGMVPEGVEELLRMVLSEGDCMSLARLSKVLFHTAGSGRPVRVTAPVVALPLSTGGVGSNGDHGRG
jgi:hypothetical protein